MNVIDIEKILAEAPDQIADALVEWRTATLMREKSEALLLLKFKMQNPDRTATEIKAMVNSDEGRYEAVLSEAKAESKYTRLSERLMAAKKSASMRTQLG